MIRLHTPVLALPNFSMPFTAETEACDTGVGPVLMQQGHPIAYMSKSFGTANSKLSMYEKEFLAVDKCRQYLQRVPFQILTDHRSLCSLEDQQLTTDLQRKAMSKLVGLQFHIKYKRVWTMARLILCLVWGICLLYKPFRPANQTGFKRFLTPMPLTLWPRSCYRNCQDLRIDGPAWLVLDLRR